MKLTQFGVLEFHSCLRGGGGSPVLIEEKKTKIE